MWNGHVHVWTSPFQRLRPNQMQNDTVAIEYSYDNSDEIYPYLSRMPKKKMSQHDPWLLPIMSADYEKRLYRALFKGIIPLAKYKSLSANALHQFGFHPFNGNETSQFHHLVFTFDVSFKKLVHNSAADVSIRLQRITHNFRFGMHANWVHCLQRVQR